MSPRAVVSAGVREVVDETTEFGERDATRAADANRAQPPVIEHVVHRPSADREIVGGVDHREETVTIALEVVAVIRDVGHDRLSLELDVHRHTTPPLRRGSQCERSIARVMPDARVEDAERLAGHHLRTFALGLDVATSGGDIRVPYEASDVIEIEIARCVQVGDD